MSEHVDREDLDRLRRGALSPARTISVSRHLHACALCSNEARDSVDPEAAADRVWEALNNATAGDHLSEDEMTAFVDRAMSSDELASAQEHIAECSTCRDCVNQLDALRRSMSRPDPSWRRIAIAAVVAGAIVAAAFLALRGSQPESRSITVRRGLSADALELNALVSAALRSGRMPPPAILETLNPPAVQVRSDGTGKEPAVHAPAGVVIDDVTPEFEWSAPPASVSRVVIFAGEAELARSGPLRATTWRASPTLDRGVTYSWRVEITSGDETVMIPHAPQGPARFFVLSHADHRLLEVAKRHPKDHLRLGVLAAHLGMRDDAIRELTAASTSSPAAASLVDSVRSWPH